MKIFLESGLSLRMSKEALGALSPTKNDLLREKGQLWREIRSILA